MTTTTKAAAHTPAPWRVDPDLSNIGKGGVLLSDNTEIGSSDGYECCYLRIEDARLIAAAPDLLAALKDTLDYWDSIGFSECEDDCNCVVQIVEAAIAKAEGGA